MTIYDLDVSCKTDNSSIDDGTMTLVDPELILFPSTSKEYTKFLDPRPGKDGTSYSSFYNNMQPKLHVEICWIHAVVDA